MKTSWSGRIVVGASLDALGRGAIHCSLGTVRRRGRAGGMLRRDIPPLHAQRGEGPQRVGHGLRRHDVHEGPVGDPVADGAHEVRPAHPQFGVGPHGVGDLLPAEAREHAAVQQPLRQPGHQRLAQVPHFCERPGLRSTRQRGCRRGRTGAGEGQEVHLLGYDRLGGNHDSNCNSFGN